MWQRVCVWGGGGGGKGSPVQKGQGVLSYSQVTFTGQ